MLLKTSLKKPRDEINFVGKFAQLEIVLFNLAKLYWIVWDHLKFYIEYLIDTKLRIGDNYRYIKGKIYLKKGYLILN